MTRVRVTNASQNYRLVSEMEAAGIRHGQTATAQMTVDVVRPQEALEVRFCNMPALTDVVFVDDHPGDDQQIPAYVELDMSVTRPGRYQVYAQLYSNGTTQVTALSEPTLVTDNQSWGNDDWPAANESDGRPRLQQVLDQRLVMEPTC